jgi:hypothetical protein
LFGFVCQQNHSDAKHNQTILQLLFSSSIHGYQIFSSLFGSVWQQNHSDAKQNKTIQVASLSVAVFLTLKTLPHTYNLYSPCQFMAIKYFHLYWVLFGNRTILMPNKTKHFYNFYSPPQFMAIKYFHLYWVLFGIRMVLLPNKTKQTKNLYQPTQIASYTIFILYIYAIYM